MPLCSENGADFGWAASLPGPSAAADEGPGAPRFLLEGADTKKLDGKLVLSHSSAMRRCG